MVCTMSLNSCPSIIYLLDLFILEECCWILFSVTYLLTTVQMFFQLFPYMYG